MDPNFRLIKLVDPSKSSSKIKDRFAKLTLSSNKKQAAETEQHEKQEEISDAARSHTSRKLFDEFLTDDDSDFEAEVLNRIFRSKTTTKLSDNETKEPRQSTSVRRSKSFSERLQMSDSDETNCSREEIAYAQRIQSEPMEPLRVSETQTGERKISSKLLTSDSATKTSDIPLQQISKRLSSLDIQDKAIAPAEDSSNERRKDAQLENILKQHFEMKTMEEVAIKPRMSIMTISSTATSPVSLKDTDEDSDVVIISDSDTDDASDTSYPVSTIRKTEAPSIISTTMRDRLDAFFENIPPLAPNEGPERIFQHNKTPERSDIHPGHTDESLPEESIEICESSVGSEQDPLKQNKLLEDSPTKRILRSAQKHVIIDTPSPQKSCLSPRKPRTPKKSDNTEYIQKQATPRKTRTPRKATPKEKPTPLVDSPGRRALWTNEPSTSKKTGTPKKKATPTAKVMPASPQKPQTSRKTPTPKVRKKVGTPLGESDTPKERQNSREPESKSFTPPVPQPSDAASRCSSEYQVEKINISATIKIRLQFNDDMIATVQSSPVTSSSTSRFPRLTESETTPDTEEQVHNPEHFKHRSVREQNTLTFIDITKNNFPTDSSTIKEGYTTDRNISDAGKDAEYDSGKEPEDDSGKKLEESSSEDPKLFSPNLPALQSSTSPIKEPPEPLEVITPAKKTSDIETLLLNQNESTPARSPIEQPNIQTLQKSSSPDDAAPIEIDDTAQKLLDQIYGDTWKTPALVKSIKKAPRVKEPIGKDESMMDFSRFHTNIKSDLESTRLTDVKSPVKNKSEHDFKVPISERKPVKKKEIVEKKAVTERKLPRRIKGQVATQRTKAIFGSDKSDSDFNASSDESWKNVLSTSSSSSADDNDDKIRYPSTRKKNGKKSKKKNSSKDEVIYLDLSSDVIKVQEINESPCANKDEAFQKRLEEFLNTFKCPDKKKLEATPKNNKIKRKLFTPRFGEEDEASPVLIDRKELNALENDVVTLTAPLPPMFEPINKHLESVKTGKPIFSLKTPKTPNTVSKKNKENLPTPRSETPRSTSSTLWSTSSTPHRTISKKREHLESELLNTPSDTYGFLQSLDVKVAKTFCHPDALIYRENYKTKKEELAKRLYNIYNANIFKDELDVTLVWNKKLLNTAGRCSCSTKLGKRVCRIELSDKVLTSADRLRCTLIHELCHAASWIFSGEHGHGATWKKWAQRANEIFPELPKIKVCHDYDIDYKYTYKCTMCNAKSHAHSKSKKVENIRCAYCHGAIEIFLNKKDKDGNVLPTPVRQPTGFAKFVKDNYKKHKRPDLKHADVMKLLSNEFALLNVDGKN